MMKKLFAMLMLMTLVLAGCSQSAQNEGTNQPNGSTPQPEVQETSGITSANYVIELRADNSEMWLVDENHNETCIVKNKNSEEMEELIYCIYEPQFSPDKTKIFFMTPVWATSNAIHVYDIETQTETFVTASNYLEVITEGEFAGNIIVNQHRYYDEGGSYDFYYIYDSEGKELKELGEDKDIRKLEASCDVVSYERVQRAMYYLARYIGARNEGIVAEDVETFLTFMVGEAGNDAIQEIFINNLYADIDADAQIILRKKESTGPSLFDINPQYIKYLSQEIFNVDLDNSEKEYCYSPCDPPMIDLKLDSIKDLGNGNYQAIASSYDVTGALYEKLTLSYWTDGNTIQVSSFAN